MSLKPFSEFLDLQAANLQLKVYNRWRITSTARRLAWAFMGHPWDIAEKSRTENDGKSTA